MVRLLGAGEFGHSFKHSFFLIGDNEDRYHVPVAIYFLTFTHHLFLVLNSSINFIIYCLMGRQFREQLKNMLTKSS